MKRFYTVGAQDPWTECRQLRALITSESTYKVTIRRASEKQSKRHNIDSWDNETFHITVLQEVYHINHPAPLGTLTYRSHHRVEETYKRTGSRQHRDKGPR
jgi:hypothetical protein